MTVTRTRAGRLRARTAVPLLLALPLLVTAGGPARADGPEVVGSAPVMVNATPSRGIGTVALDAVRRIPGGTVVYYSLSTAPGGDSTADLAAFNPGVNLFLGDTGLAGRIAVTDGTNAYTRLRVRDAGSTNAAIGTRFTGDPFLPGAFYTVYEVLAPLPATVSSVDVWLGAGAYFQDVPVGDGALEPSVDGRYPLPLGGPWPAVDTAAVSTADASQSVFPLQVKQSDAQRSITTAQQGRRGTVDLAADVLFAVDQATLTSAAQSRISQAAATINARSAGGRITVTGHTDSTGTPAHNQDLSQRRAAAVAAALRPLVRIPGVSFAVAGKGEADPVADNATAQGRQANRRVTIGYTVKGA